MISLFKIAEKCQVLLGKGDIQSLLSAVQDAYASVVKKEFYEGMADGDSAIAGEHIYTFGKVTPFNTTIFLPRIANVAYTLSSSTAQVPILLYSHAK